MVTYRRPTIDEAIRHVLGSKTDAYKRTCFRFWRNHYGDAFADKVRAEVIKKMKK